MATNVIQMYVNIKKNNVSTSTGYGKYYLTADTNETLTNDGLVNHIMHHNCAVGREAIAAVIKKLGECIPELVAQGQPVKIEGLGTFYPTAESSPILIAKLLDAKYNPLDALKGIQLTIDSYAKGKRVFLLHFAHFFVTLHPNMKRIVFLIGILWGALGIQTQAQGKYQETPNAQQARRMFMDIYNRLYGQEGGSLHYKVNIIGIYKTEGTIWMKQKKSKFIDERYIAWNDDVTYHRLERKKNRVVIYDAHSDERDKYATKFKFVPDNYTYSIKDEKKAYAITLKAKKGVKGLQAARVMLDKHTHYPTSIRVKVGIFHTTIKISNFKLGGIGDELFKFPREQYNGCEYIDKRI